MEIKEGDVVKLRSGSEWLTVNSIDGLNAYVIWFTEKKLNTFKLRLSSLISEEEYNKTNFDEM